MGRLSAAVMSVISICDGKQLHHKKTLLLKHHPKQTRGTCPPQQVALTTLLLFQIKATDAIEIWISIFRKKKDNTAGSDLVSNF